MGNNCHVQSWETIVMYVQLRDPALKVLGNSEMAVSRLHVCPVQEKLFFNSIARASKSLGFHISEFQVFHR